MRICPPLRRGALLSIVSSFRSMFADRDRLKERCRRQQPVFRRNRTIAEHSALDDPGAGFSVMTEQGRLPVGPVAGLCHGPRQPSILQPARAIVDTLRAFEMTQGQIVQTDAGRSLFNASTDMLALR